MSKPKRKITAYTGGSILGEIPKNVLKQLEVYPDGETILAHSRAASIFLTKNGYHKTNI